MFFLEAMLMKDNFVNLHCHSEFSIQDSVIRIEDLTDLVLEYGQNAVAVSDHSSVAGFPYLEKECINKGLKPIFGNEFYCNNSYEEKTRERDHLLFLAKNDTGLKNIFKLQKIAVENYYYKPILSYEILNEYNTDGIIATSACSLGKISKLILDKEYKEAECFAEKFFNLFNGNFYLEFQFHPDYPDQAIINNYLVEIADDFGIPVMCSCDCHFLNEDNKIVRRAIQAISWHKTFDEVKDSLSSNCVGNTNIVIQNAIDSGFEDIDLVKKMIKNTSKIANECNAKLPGNERKVPVFDKYNELDKLFEKVF